MGTVEDFVDRVAAAQFAQLLADAMHIPGSRVHAQLVDLGIPGKAGVVVCFTPPLDPNEQALFEMVMPLVCIQLGVSAPMKMAEA